MEKRVAHYGLGQIKSAFRKPPLNRTRSAFTGATALFMDDHDVIGVIQGLTVSDLDKSMTSRADPTVWQDVYKPSSDWGALYVKFTLDWDKDYLLISFKEA